MVNIMIMINKKQINAIKSVLEGMYAKAVNYWTSISIRAEQIGPKYNSHLLLLLLLLINKPTTLIIKSSLFTLTMNYEL